jgi:pyruvate kinase
MKHDYFVKTKIIATIGPASSEESVLRQMIRAGLSVARLNFSHGSYEHYREVVQRIRKISREEGSPVALLQDLSGPKIRMGVLPEPVNLQKGQILKLTIDKKKDPDALLFTDFKPLTEVVKTGESILVNDGYIEMTALEVNDSHVLCKVITPGIVTSRKGINLPQSTLTIPVFTEKDRADLEFGLQQGVDFVAMSFVDSPCNIVPVKEMMKEFSWEIPVIAKIERPVALENIDGILDAFDGIMIARGDLGVEIPPEDVPIHQKRLIQMANARNKLVITATQMLESMIDNPRPTRAEASDVSNAILDGSDVVMLSGETAVGMYPVNAVSMMQRIAKTTERSQLYPQVGQSLKEARDHTEAIARSAVRIAADLGAKYIVVFSFTGMAALKVSKFRPTCPVFAFTAKEEVVPRMAAYWGIYPHFIEFTSNTDEMFQRAEEVVKSKKLIEPGDLVVTISGNAPMKGATNMLKISRFLDPGATR